MKHDDHPQKHCHSCTCGHEEQPCGCEHAHHHSCGCDHDHLHSDKSQLPQLLVGAGLFAAGLILDALSLPGWIAFVAAYLLLGSQILAAGAKGLFKGHVLDENFLMGIATLGAFAIGEFPEAVGIMLFYRIGEYFEHLASERSRSQIMEAVDLRPETVILSSGEIIPAEHAQVGQQLLIRPGDRIPLDSIVIQGESRIDTAPITGEPVPVSVHPGDRVISGCVNTTGQLTVQVEKQLSESMVTRILHAVEDATAGKPRIDRFITRFARIYTPVVVATAALTAVLPSLVTGQWRYWIYTALSFLVMSCPCALVLSVPLAFFSGIGLGSKQGILFKDGLAMEALAGIRAVAMDKTGTVTRGEFRVQNADPVLLQLCASCEQSSSHPIAQSIVAAAKEQGLSLETPTFLEELPGHGIRAVLRGETLLCGNEKLLSRFGVPIPASAGGTVLVAKEGCYLGSLMVSDSLKEGAKEAVQTLHRLGLHTAMLTGDSEAAAKAVSDAVGIETCHARLLPEEKLAHLQQLRAKSGAVMFVGDGINDAPVLAGADVGAAMGAGADAAIEAADVVFLYSDPASIPAAVQIARRTKAIALQNVVFALVVKLLVMVLGLTGHASMWMAVFADSGVAMLCVLNSVRQLWHLHRK